MEEKERQKDEDKKKRIESNMKDMQQRLYNESTKKKETESNSIALNKQILELRATIDIEKSEYITMQEERDLLKKQLSVLDEQKEEIEHQHSQLERSNKRLKEELENIKQNEHDESKTKQKLESDIQLKDDLINDLKKKKKMGRKKMFENKIGIEFEKNLKLIC